MLILQAERDALLKPLLAVTGIVERRHTLPILSNVLIEKRADKWASWPRTWKSRSPPPAATNCRAKTSA